MRLKAGIVGGKATLEQRKGRAPGTETHTTSQYGWDRHSHPNKRTALVPDPNPLPASSVRRLCDWQLSAPGLHTLGNSRHGCLSQR